MKIDQINKVNAALVKKNSKLTENFNITNQQNKKYKLNNSQMSKDLKEQSKKTKVFIKTSQGLKTSYHNQKAISDL